jgi:predicted branched-subunit amino acid permease
MRADVLPAIRFPMSRSSADDARAPYWSHAGFVEGMRLTLPFIPGTAVFAMALGTIAAQKGLSVTDTAIMSAVVYAGAGQLLALEIWPQHFTLAAVAALALVTLTVNLRFVLMSAALRPWFGPLPAWQAYPTLFFTTDSTWLISMRYHAGGGWDAGIFLGSGVMLWSAWVTTTALGYLVGAQIAQPERFGLDLILPVFFSAFMVPLWRGPRRAIPWVVAGLVALAVAWLVPGSWFIIAGALAGSIAGGFIDD